MPDVHTIRLRHPWQCQPREVGVCWTRSFHWPAGLTPREIARLVIEGLPASATVELNGERLQQSETDQFDVTRLLAAHNRLAIAIPEGSPTNETECPFDVRLEIVEG